MKKIYTMAAAAVLASLLTGCNSDNDKKVVIDPITPEPEFMQVRVVHASADAPTVDVFSGTTAIDVLQNVDYQMASGFLALQTGEYNLRVEADLPMNMTTEVLNLSATLDADTDYNVLALGNVAAIEALIVANPTTAVGDGNIRAQVVHGAPSAPTVDIYVTAPGTDLASEQAISTLSFKEFSPQVEVPAGSYQIRVTAAGSTSVVFDSGTLDLAQGLDLFITATENVATGDSPVSLLVADGTGSSIIRDINAQAELRAIHAISDAPAVDVFADVTDGDDILLFDDPAFKDVSDYISVVGSTYAVDVRVAADNSIVAIDDAMVTLMDGFRYTAIANNVLAMPDLDLIVDDGRRLATAAQVRIFHASPATGGVDIYVSAEGDIDAIEPAFSDVQYSTDVLAETGYVQLPQGDYIVTVTPTGTKTEAIVSPVLSLEVGKIYTAIAVDGDMMGDAPQLVLADDFNAVMEN